MTTGGSGETIKTMLAKSSEFKGTLSFRGTVRVDGRFEGKILSDGTLIVGENALIFADIAVGRLIISGRVNGNITAAESVSMKSTSRVEGDVWAPAFSVDVGAIFDGTCNMKEAQAANSKGEKNGGSYSLF